MVAAVNVSKQCTAPEEYFCRLVAYEGRSQTTAYRIAWKSTVETAKVCAIRVMSRPHVASRIAEMRAAADREGMMAMAERRRLLAETARNVPRGTKPTHSDRIAAIREDATLAGERRPDTAIAVGFVVSDVLGALHGGHAPLPLAAEATAVLAADAPGAGEARETALASQPDGSANFAVYAPLSVLDVLAQEVAVTPAASWDGDE